MRIRFLRGYRGRFTDEEYYEAGAVVDLAAGAAIIAEGAAVAVPEPEEEPGPDTEGEGEEEPDPAESGQERPVTPAAKPARKRGK